MTKRKIIILIIGVVIMALILFPKGKKSEISYAIVQRQDIKSTVTGSGTLQGIIVANLKFKTSGKLTYLGVKPGDKVKKGQLIAKLDDRDLGIALQQAQNNLRDKVAILENIHDQVKDHASDETFAQRALRTSAEVAKDNAYDSLRAAKLAFQNTALLSPISGIVTNQDSVSLGENVTPSQLIAQINDFSGYEISMDVDEADVDKVKIGQETEITLDAYPDKKFTGKITTIVPSTKTTSSGATVINVKSSFKDKEIRAIYGLSGQVNITIQRRDNVLSIPQDALVDSNEVYIKKDANYTKVKVETGIKSDTDVEILSGLNGGEEVVLNPTSFSNLTQSDNSILGRLLKLGR